MMKPFIFGLFALPLDIFAYRIFVACFSNGVYKVSICPKFPSPENFFYGWLSSKNFPSCYALDCLNYLFRTIHWH